MGSVIEAKHDSHLDGFGDSDISPDAFDVLPVVIASKIWFSTIDPIVSLDSLLAQVLLVEISVERREDFRGR